MDFDRNFRNPNFFQRKTFMSYEGMILDIQPMTFGNRESRNSGCMQFVTIEDMAGNPINFILTPTTYVVGMQPLEAGMKAIFFVDADAAVPLIYPPQYNALVVAPVMENSMVMVDYFNNMLVNQDRSLQLNMNEQVDVMTTNNQYFMGNVENHYLVVEYDRTTRSIPAQTTPNRVIVLCNM